jgi:hypothetical protein
MSSPYGRHSCVACEYRLNPRRRLIAGQLGKWLNPLTKQFHYYWMCNWCRTCHVVPREWVWPNLP